MTSCKLRSCSFPTLNDCQQICDSNATHAYCTCADKLYELDGDGKTCNLRNGSKCNCGNDKHIYCDEDENDCQCKYGYQPERLDGAYRCKPNCKYLRHTSIYGTTYIQYILDSKPWDKCQTYLC